MVADVGGVSDLVCDLVAAAVDLLVRPHCAGEPCERRLRAVVVGDVPERLLVTGVVAMTIGELLVIRMERRQRSRVVLGRGGDEARDVPDLAGAEPARERGHAAAAVRDLAHDRVVARLRRVEVRAGLPVRLRRRQRVAAAAAR